MDQSGFQHVRERIRQWVAARLQSRKRRDVVFTTYEQARLAALNGGYADERVADVVAAKTQRYRDQLERDRGPFGPYDLQILLALATARCANPAQSLHVLDVGGACGAHYLAARSGLSTIPFRWTVVETPAMVEKARGIWTGCPEISFSAQLTGALEAMQRVDVTICCGTLHCVEDPYQLLADLSRAKAAYLLVNRAAVSVAQRDIFCVSEHRIGSNGPGPLPPGFADGPIRYAYYHPDHDRVRRCMQESHELIWEAQERSPRYDAHDYPIMLRAYFGRRR